MTENIYETEKLVSEYLLFHYGTAEQVLGWEEGPVSALGFPERIVKRFSEGRVARALDLGCAVGRSSWEMSRDADEVLGIDFSQAFVDAAEEIGRAGKATARRLEEAALATEVEVSLPEGVGEAVFEQGDAMNLRDDLGDFDRVLAANLLCRLGDPGKLLERLPDLVKSGGELVLTTPCTWLEEFTPPENWPEAGTLEWLKGELGGDFELLEQHDEPFLIRETARKFQWTVALLTKWRRR
ncbi:MAG: putative 4-mercaptohistidine N1-methyltransferase [Akkermansiaceae bacterium]|nr:putative 4-mercaptohistidine N1-methyltransferase [Akkermansiaceae bacterium]